MEGHNAGVRGSATLRRAGGKRPEPRSDIRSAHPKNGVHIRGHKDPIERVGDGRQMRGIVIW